MCPFYKYSCECGYEDEKMKYCNKPCIYNHNDNKCHKGKDGFCPHYCLYDDMKGGEV